MFTRIAAWLFAALALTLSTPAANAQAPEVKHEVPGLKLPAPATVESSEGFVTITAETESARVEWVVIGTRPVKFNPIGKTVIVSTPADAVIHVYCIGVVEGELTKHAKTVISVKAGQGPQPPPVTPPPVTPPPTVAPKGSMMVLIVEDPLARAKYPHLTAIINSKELRDALAKAGHQFRVISVRDPEIKDAKLGPYIEEAGGAPALLMIDREGTVYSPQQVPTTPAGVIDALNRAIKGGS